MKTSIVVLFVIMSAALPAAQETRGYAGGAVMVAVQGSHSPGTSPSLPNSGAGGRAVGVTGEIGGRVSRSVDAGIEISLPARIESVQVTDYFRVFEQANQHRDLAISGVVRLHAVDAAPVGIALVAGGGPVQEHTRQKRRDQIGPVQTFPPVFGPYGNEQTFSRWTFGAVVGADLEIVLGRHASLVPAVRVHWVKRSTSTSEQGWFLGLDRLMFRPAFGFRARF
jgi:hypothetical protein